MAQRRSSVKSGAAKSLHSIVRCFETLPDPRHQRNGKRLNSVRHSDCVLPRTGRMRRAGTLRGRNPGDGRDAGRRKSAHA